MDVYSWLRRRKRPTLPTQQTTSQKAEEEFLGVTDELIDLITSFTLDTFKNFPFRDIEEGNIGVEANLQKDLSDWQERHAVLVLSKVKELSQLRFRLCPRYMKEREFWRAYFTLVRSYVAKYELNAIRIHNLKQMKIRDTNVSGTTACEVEMLEAKQLTDSEAAKPMA